MKFLLIRLFIAVAQGKRIYVHHIWCKDDLTNSLAALNGRNMFALRASEKNILLVLSFCINNIYNAWH